MTNELKVRVHRGTQEIGGSCIELQTGDARLVLDVGRPLSARRGDQVDLPDVPGLASGDDPTLLGVVISHGHLDHYGLLDQVSPNVPVIAGEAAAAIVEAARFFSPGPALRPAIHLRDRVPLQVGPFTITPYLVDHSAFDAYAVQVDTGDHRFFYTGDLRGHGRKAALFEQLIAEPPVDVDILLMEGTHIGASAADEPTHATGSESDVERAMATTMRGTPGLVVAAGSAQNVDRLVTCYRAARRAGRTLLIDLYGVAVARATGRGTIPQPGFPGLGVWVPRRQKVRVMQSGEFHRTREVRGLRVFPEQIAAHPERYAIYTASSSIAELVTAGALDDSGTVIWSMWSGYLKEPSGQRLRSMCATNGVAFEEHHTSGHATVTDLQRLADAFHARALVPIHTEGGFRYGGIFANAEAHVDGDWWAA
ncbi:MBL fold metallo-hydrolase [Cellulomonas humilata]|uniref:Ribonuclease J n=1 Tax=Cellulomonas humilata TaxID=144055 RepID=A0ABU0ELB6_9CELL|nr:MBL fold metallo-hydrolase [Cellulomonas humilata]MDQ0375984.1 ribonuclease J [Cellulomonas humilata]